MRPACRSLWPSGTRVQSGSVVACDAPAASGTSGHAPSAGPEGPGARIQSGAFMNGAVSVLLLLTDCKRHVC